MIEKEMNKDYCILGMITRLTIILMMQTQQLIQLIQVMKQVHLIPQQEHMTVMLDLQHILQVTFFSK